MFHRLQNLPLLHGHSYLTGLPLWLRGKESACQSRRRRFLGWEYPLEEELETHSSVLAWKIPWTEEPGRLQSIGLQRVKQDWKDWATCNYFNFYMKWMEGNCLHSHCLSLNYKPLSFANGAWRLLAKYSFSPGYLHLHCSLHCLQWGKIYSCSGDIPH